MTRPPRRPAGCLLAAWLVLLIGLEKPALAAAAPPSAAVPPAANAGTDALPAASPATPRGLLDLAAPTFGAPESVAAARLALRGLDPASPPPVPEARRESPAGGARARVRHDPILLEKRHAIANAVVSGVFLGGSGVALAYGLTGVSLLTEGGFNYFSIPWLALSGGGGILFVIGFTALMVSISHFGKAHRLAVRAALGSPEWERRVEVEAGVLAGPDPEPGDRLAPRVRAIPVLEF